MDDETLEVTWSFVIFTVYSYIVTHKGTSPFQSEETGQGFIPCNRHLPSDYIAESSLKTHVARMWLKSCQHSCLKWNFGTLLFRCVNRTSSWIDGSIATKQTEAKANHRLENLQALVLPCNLGWTVFRFAHAMCMHGIIFNDSKGQVTDAELCGSQRQALIRIV